MVNNKLISNVNTISKAVKDLSEVYSLFINNHIPLFKFPSVMMWGAPGVGKSQGVRQIAQEIQLRTNKKVAVTDVRLLLFNPVDLRGIPTANADKTLAIWLKPKIFQMDDSEDVINILFLDEISAAPQSVQAAAYQITLDRMVGEHKLPDNCIVIAAGNRVTDKSVAYTMPKALANRLCHLFIECDYNEWRKWAANKGIHGAVIGFLDAHKELLMQFETEDENVAFATPRSWEMVSNILNAVNGDIKNVFSIISGCIGENIAYLFKNWMEDVADKAPTAEEVFGNSFVGIPSRPERVYFLIGEIVRYAKTHYTLRELENAVNYVVRLPLEFRNKVFNDLLKNKEAQSNLKKIDVFTQWLESNGHDWSEYDG